MDLHHIHAGVEVLLVASIATETRINTGPMCHLACKQTLPLFLLNTCRHSVHRNEFNFYPSP